MKNGWYIPHKFVGVTHSCHESTKERNGVEAARYFILAQGKTLEVRMGQEPKMHEIG